MYLLRDAQKVSPGVDVVTFSAAVAACRNGGEWQQALSLMEVLSSLLGSALLSLSSSLLFLLRILLFLFATMGR